MPWTYGFTESTHGHAATDGVVRDSCQALVGQIISVELEAVIDDVLTSGVGDGVICSVDLSSASRLDTSEGVASLITLGLAGGNNAAGLAALGFAVGFIAITALRIISVL